MTGGEGQKFLNENYVILDEYSEDVKAYVKQNKRILELLSELSNLHPLDLSWDLDIILRAEYGMSTNPSVAIERLERIRRAAIEIERAVSAMGELERSNFDAGLLDSKNIDYHKYCSDVEYKSDIILSFCQAFQDSADYVKKHLTSELLHLPISKNENRRNIAVAIAVAVIYFDHTERAPPKSGENGPFQRLLRDVYLALGRGNVDLRGPLRKVHEYRKNRHS